MFGILKDKPLEPDLEAAIANIRRQGTPRRVFLFEHGFEPGVKQALCRRLDLCRGPDEGVAEFPLAREIRLHHLLGQEFVRVFPSGIIWRGLPASTTAAAPAQGPIRSWQDFEAYPWPRARDVDFAVVEWIERNLPGNMV